MSASSLMWCERQRESNRRCAPSIKQMERQTLTARLRQSVPLSGLTKHLQFEIEEVPRFDFAAGQFVSMQTQHDGREITRAYSIASAPVKERVFDVCLNRVQDGF